MVHGSVFETNRTQAVRLPKEVRFPAGVKDVVIRKVGAERILTPADRVWDSFFDDNEAVSDDFMVERNQPPVQEREAL